MQAGLLDRAMEEERGLVAGQMIGGGLRGPSGPIVKLARPGTRAGRRRMRRRRAGRYEEYPVSDSTYEAHVSIVSAKNEKRKADMFLQVWL